MLSSKGHFLYFNFASLTMNKTARALFLLVGCIFPILIGGLHTFVHFSELVTPEIYNYLQKEVTITGQQQPIWNSWGIVSFMMGASFIVIGLLNFSILTITPKTKALPVLPIISMIIYQFCVVFAGYSYNGPFQLYGGMFGIVLISICLLLTLRERAPK